MRYIFLLFFVLVSCESQNNIHEQNVNLLNEVITLHDELMVDMKELRSLKSQLEEAGINSEDKLVIDLDNARSSMMTFMKEFSEEQLLTYLDKISDEKLYAYNVYQIEGPGRNLFEKIEGDQNTIMGLPILMLKNYLRDFKC